MVTLRKKIFFLQSGFTLIELLVVFVVMSMLMMGSLVSFSSFGKNQTFKSSVSDIEQYLNLARSRALSRVKPPICAGKTLKYYQVYIIAPGSTYRLKVMCDTTLSILESKLLPTGVTFTDAAPISINFAVSTGTTDATQTIAMSGNGNTATITVSQTGVISAQ